MKMKLLRSLVIAGLIAAGVNDLHAAINLNIYLPNITPRTGTGILLADGANDGFGDLTFASDPLLVNSRWSPDTDDILLGMWNLTGTDPDGALVVTFSLVSGVTTGDKLLFVFYPNLPYSPGLTGPGPNQAFGSYRDDLGGDPYGYGLGDAFIGWTVPADGAGLNIYREENISANLTTIPEPTAGVLVGLSALGLMAALRRRS